ncbi:hypothetical protein Leryth_025279 [Lithospermum erythrorhizon]|nr:hypothetical protein Leryth_025279 [Lithospermum erythrorhizon]
MENGHTLPFVVGQKVEARSFIKGFRSSWFRCEIKDIGRRHGQILVLVDYFDFTEQKPLWLKLYQDPPYGRKSKHRTKNLMLRPEYPVIYHDTPVTDLSTAQQIVLVVNGPWKVGDMVDWFTCGCYWSGSVTEILGTNKAKIALTPPPAGEGGFYDDVSVEDLRPTLEWSIESGWTVPISKDREESCCCARLISPIQQEYASVTNYLDRERPHTRESSTTRQANEGCSDQSIGATSAEKRISHAGESSERPPDEGCSNWSTGKTSAQSRSFEDFNGSYQHTVSSEAIDPLEDVVLGLEELSNKVKWLKRILKDGIPLSNSKGPSWEFVEHHGSHEHK